MALEPITRAEQIMSGESLEPITREEMFYAKAGGQDVQTPAPITRKEMFLQKIAENGGGSGGTVTLDDVTELIINTIDDMEIPVRFFYDKNNLKKIKIGSSLTNIGDYAFSACSNLESVSLEYKQKSDYDTGSFKIEKNAFSACEKLAEVNLSGCSMIGEGAFEYCKNLQHIADDIAKPSVTKYAFAYCSSLVDFSLKVGSITGENVFLGCSNLRRIKLPACSIISGQTVFNQCYALEAVILSNTYCEIDILSLVDSGIVTAEGVPTSKGFVYVPTVLYDSYVENFKEQIIELGMDDATAEALAMALLRKIEDYPEICG